MLEPSEKQFDLPTLLIGVGYHRRRSGPTIGAERQPVAMLRVVDAYAPKITLSIFGHVGAAEPDDLIGSQRTGVSTGREAATLERTSDRSRMMKNAPRSVCGGADENRCIHDP